MDRFRAVAAEEREVMHFPRGAGFHHQAGGGAQALAREVLVHRREGKQRRDRHVLTVQFCGPR